MEALIRDHGLCDALRLWSSQALSIENISKDVFAMAPLLVVWLPTQFGLLHTFFLPSMSTGRSHPPYRMFPHGQFRASRNLFWLCQMFTLPIFLTPSVCNSVLDFPTSPFGILQDSHVRFNSGLGKTILISLLTTLRNYSFMLWEYSCWNLDTVC